MIFERSWQFTDIVDGARPDEQKIVSTKDASFPKTRYYPELQDKMVGEMVESGREHRDGPGDHPRGQGP